MDLYEHFLRGETLIIEHLRFEREGEHWRRHELHSIVGHASEEWSLLCLGPDDHSGMKGPPGAEEDDDCELCRRHKVHTRALHCWHQARATPRRRNLDL